MALLQTVRCGNAHMPVLPSADRYLMRVVLVGTGRRPIPPTGYGGIERMIAGLADGLRQAGEDVTILNSFRSDRYSTGWAFERRLPWLLRRRQFDIVHVSTSRAALALGLCGIPYVFSTHTPRWLDPRQGDFLQRTLFEQERLAVRLAEVTIAPSGEPLRAAVDAVRGRRGPVVRIPVGVDTARFQARTDGVAHCTLGVGVVERRKQWHLAAEAIAGTPMRLTVVGPIRETDYAEELRRAGVQLRGEIPEEELLAEYERAQIVFHPSRSETGMAGAPLQAMAFSRPVLGGPAINSIEGALTCESNESGPLRHFLTDWSTRLDADERLRHEIGAKSRAAVETHYSWSTIAAAHESVYRQVLAGRRRPRRPKAMGKG